MVASAEDAVEDGLRSEASLMNFWTALLILVIIITALMVILEG